MSNGLIELRKLLAPASTTVTGSVVKIESGAFIIATAGGTIAAVRAPGDGSAYSVGAEVTVKNGVVSGKRSEGEVYVA